MAKYGFKNKKGNVADIVLIVVLLFSLLLAMVSTFKVFDDIALDINKTSSYSNETRSAAITFHDRVPRSMDVMFALVFFGSFISVAVMAFFIRSHALFFFISVLVLAIFVFVSASLSNVYADYIAANPALNTFASNNFSVSNHLMNNYPTYTAVLGFVILIALFAKPGGTVGSGI